MSNSRPGVKGMPANCELSFDGKYIFESVSGIPVMRHFPHKGHIAGDNSVVIGDMKIHDLLPKRPNDLIKFKGMCANASGTWSTKRDAVC